MGSFHSDIREGGIKREARNVRSMYNPSLPFVRFLHNFPEATTEKKKYKNSRDSQFNSIEAHRLDIHRYPSRAGRRGEWREGMVKSR